MWIETLSVSERSELIRNMIKVTDTVMHVHLLVKSVICESTMFRRRRCGVIVKTAGEKVVKV